MQQKLLLLFDTVLTLVAANCDFRIATCQRAQLLTLVACILLLYSHAIVLRN